jgi:hypothetical protein
MVNKPFIQVKFQWFMKCSNLQVISHTTNNKQQTTHTHKFVNHFIVNYYKMQFWLYPFDDNWIADELIQFAKRIIEENDKFQREGKGAFEIDGQMIDMPMVHCLLTFVLILLFCICICIVRNTVMLYVQVKWALGVLQKANIKIWESLELVNLSSRLSHTLHVCDGFWDK